MMTHLIKQLADISDSEDFELRVTKNDKNRTIKILEEYL